ncbi:hypothetical protein MRB53_021802 [Persea americana]|uniref:Uncharacterized protein n=1 Tax=Persea americana TaxID=3435 RepID=A0ACC2L588_PERAE|nr:hypothetical protein MRB53_021802 [Persea americana]
MASYGTIQRPSTLPNPASFQPPQPPPTSTHSHKNMTHFNLLQYFNIPSSPEAAAIRIVRNMRYFHVYYTVLVWLILFVSLIPRRLLSLILLVVTTAVGCFYLLLLRAVPDSVILHRIIDPRLVVALLGIVTVVELVLTRATIHLLVSLAVGVFIILVHAVLRMGDDLYVTEEAMAVGELLPLVSEKSKRDHDPEVPV